MKRVLVGTAFVILAMGVMFYVLIDQAQEVTHIHFTTRGGVLKNVVYYSPRPAETPSEHECDGRFADMRDDLYETHLELWKEKYGAEMGQSR
jgi:hypothetical protein